MLELRLRDDDTVEGSSVAVTSAAGPWFLAKDLLDVPLVTGGSPLSPASDSSFVSFSAGLGGVDSAGGATSAGCTTFSALLGETADALILVVENSADFTLGVRSASSDDTSELPSEVSPDIADIGHKASCKGQMQRYYNMQVLVTTFVIFYLKHTHNPQGVY